MSSKRQRIAHVLPSTNVLGGTEHATLRIAHAVKDAGFESVFFCIEGDTPVRRFFANQGLPVIPYAPVEPSLRRPFPYLRAARRLALEFTRQRIDVIHCADVLSAHYTALAGRFAQIPVVCHVRNRHEQISRRDRIFLRPVDEWVFVSKDTWQRFGVRVPPEHGRVIYDGIAQPPRVANDSSVVRAEFGLCLDTPIVGMVARISPQKDFRTLARAARLITSQNPTVRFLIVGDFEQQPAYRQHYGTVRQWLAEEGVAENFVFTGFRQDVPRLVAAMDIFVLSTHFEGLPLVLLEGMGQSKPTIATAVDGIPEIIQHGQTGLLHAPGDHDELARLIMGLLNDSEEAERLGEAARLAVESFWTEERFGRDLETLYHGVIRPH